MALSNEGIAKVRSDISEIKSLTKTLSDYVDKINTIIGTDGNFQYFKTGTRVGADISNQLRKTNQITTDVTIREINNSLGAVESLCQRQQELNNQRAAEAQQSTTPTENSSIPKPNQAVTGNTNYTV